MKTYQFNDGVCSKNRHPKLYLVKGTDYVRFDGETEIGFCVVTKATFEKAGKWSNTTYQLDIPDNVTPFEFILPLDTRRLWGQEYKNWQEASDALKVPVSVLKDIIMEQRQVGFEQAFNRLEEQESPVTGDNIK